MSNLQQAIANIEIKEKRKNRSMKIKNTYTFEQAVAQEVEISFKDGKQFHEIKGEKIIEWDNPDYTENRLECRSYDIIPSNYGIKELPTKILRDADFSKFGTDDLTERIKLFLSKDKELRSFGIELVKTGFLFHGPPGTGKTHKINNTVMSLIGEKGISFKLTMSDINIGDFTDFLNYKTPPEGCDKLFVVIEDLGGGEQPDLGMRSMASQDHLLAFLDGNSIPANWRHIPIVIFSTTNYPMLFLANLIDRPGRFDDVVEVYYPSGELLVEYAEDFMKLPLPEFAKREIAKGEISIAHVKGALIRNIVYGEPVHTTIQKMRAWTEVIRKSMEKKEI